MTYRVNRTGFCPRGLETSVAELRVLKLPCKEGSVVAVVMLTFPRWSPSAVLCRQAETILVKSRWEWQTRLSSEMLSISSSHRHGLSPVAAFPSPPLLNSGRKLVWSVSGMKVAVPWPTSWAWASPSQCCFTPRAPSKRNQDGSVGETRGSWGQGVIWGSFSSY